MSIVPLLLLLASAAVEPAGEPPLSTPPLPPGVVCGGPTLELAELPLTAETTYAQVVAKWGEPRPEGPGGEVASYYLTCDARLWLSFEPSGRRRLTRAILLTGSFVPQTRTIVDTLETTRTRRCSDVPRRRRIPGATVAEAWGPPDNEVGSGIVRWTYKMAGGGGAQVFPQGRGQVMVACASKWIGVRGH